MNETLRQAILDEGVIDPDSYYLMLKYLRHDSHFVRMVQRLVIMMKPMTVKPAERHRALSVMLERPVNSTYDLNLAELRALLRLSYKSREAFEDMVTGALHD